MLPEGWRPIRSEDAATVATLIDEDEVFAGFRSRLGSQDVLDMSARTNLEHDSWLLEEGGRVVAAGGGERHAGTYFARGCVHPSAKGRGLGSLLLDFSEQRARDHAVSTVHQVALGPDQAARRLLESRGYRHVRRHYEMTVELGEQPPDPELPEGLSIASQSNGPWNGSRKRRPPSATSRSPLRRRARTARGDSRKTSRQTRLNCRRLPNPEAKAISVIVRSVSSSRGRANTDWGQR
jgi:GNAT superfamily N-acetyltransferase